MVIFFGQNFFKHEIFFVVPWQIISGFFKTVNCALFKFFSERKISVDHSVFLKFLIDLGCCGNRIFDC